MHSLMNEISEPLHFLSLSRNQSIVQGQMTQSRMELARAWDRCHNNVSAMPCRPRNTELSGLALHGLMHRYLCKTYHAEA